MANPDALLYRKQMGLLDFDERMAVLIQVVQGERYRDYFFPAVAGVAYSRNPFLWNPKLRREDGFARLVAGLGTRAVERVGEDYPRMVALSHPQLRPESGAQQIRYYSQYYMDVINLAENCFETHRVHEVLAGDFPGSALPRVARSGATTSARCFSTIRVSTRSLVMTFDGLLMQTPFVEHLKGILKALEFGYGTPVDIEFTLGLVHGTGSRAGQHPSAAMPSAERVRSGRPGCVPRTAAGRGHHLRHGEAGAHGPGARYLLHRLRQSDGLLAPTESLGEAAGRRG